MSLGPFHSCRRCRRESATTCPPGPTAYQTSSHDPGIVVGFGTPGGTDFEACVELLLRKLGVTDAD